MGCGDEPPAVAIATSSLVPATASRAASQTAATSGVFCSGRRGLGIRLANPTGEAAWELPPGTEAREMAPNQIPFHSPALGTVGDWKELFF